MTWFQWIAGLVSAAMMAVVAFGIVWTIAMFAESWSRLL